MKTIGIAILAAALLAPAAAQANSEDDMQADIRCVLAMYATSRNPQYAQGAGVALLYYVGRIEGRDPTLDLAGAMKKEALRMTASDYSFNARRCGDEVKAKGEALKATGQSLQQQTKRGVGD
jgi:hypothetical protein